MIPVTEQYFLGVDGGGSTCRLRLVDPSGTQVSTVTGAGTNVTTDFDAALIELNARWAEISSETGISADQVSAHFGLAGAIDNTIRTRVAAALPFARITVSDDRETTLVGALGTADGMIFSVGTGSFAGARINGGSRLVGGWGLRLSDQASGAWLGREILTRVMLLEDGLTPASALLREIRTRFSSPADIIAHAGDPARLASLAPQIVAAARAGDPAATEVMAAGAAYIVKLIDALGYRPGTRICALGGLGPHYRDFLPENIVADMSEPDGSALDGAVILAQQIPEEAPA